VQVTNIAMRYFMLTDRIWILLKASRFPSWTFGPILFSIGLVHSGSIPNLKPFGLLCAALQIFALSLPLCIGMHDNRLLVALPLLHLQLLDLLVVFGVNDVYDYASDRRNPRKLADNLEGGVLDPAHHSDVLNAAYFSTIFIISSALVNRRRDNTLAAMLLVLLGWQYSSPPLRLKEVPVMDSLSNGAIVFLAWFCGFSFSGLSISDVPFTGIMLSLCTAGIHALGAVVDSEVDFAAGQTTIATALGKRVAAIFAASC
jgi:4-hydroxybenzoate polyprenyltransferase